MSKLNKIVVLLFSCVATIAIQAQSNSIGPNSSAPTPNSTTAVTTTAPNNIQSLAEIYPSVAQPPNIDAAAYILIDANSGQILAEKNAEVRREPASLTKLMSMYVISSALKSGRLKLTDNVPISKEAWRTGGSRMFVQVGTQVPVQELINGIVVASGNDAAVAMAEYVGGTEENFANLMNQSAAQLGMKNSHFTDVNGLPTDNHFSCAYDLAILARSIILDFPEYYPWYGQKWEEYNNIKQPNRNRLLFQDPSVDGLKTGFTDKAGYCLIASAKRNDIRLISVVLGATSAKARQAATQALLNWGFHNFSSHQLYAANQPLAAPRVWFGAEKYAQLGLARGLSVTIPSSQYQNLKAFMTLDSHIKAPIRKGQPYGKVDVMLGDRLLLSEPVVALADDPVGNMVERLRDHITLMFHGS